MVQHTVTVVLLGLIKLYGGYKQVCGDDYFFRPCLLLGYLRGSEGIIPKPVRLFTSLGLEEIIPKYPYKFHTRVLDEHQIPTHPHISWGKNTKKINKGLVVLVKRNAGPSKACWCSWNAIVYYSSVGCRREIQSTASNNCMIASVAPHT
jgi:hypothetical protein